MEPTDRIGVRRYRFGPRNQRGLVAGIRWEQVMIAAASLVLAVVVIRTSTSSLRVYEAFGLVAATLAFSFWPVRGRTSQQWLPTLALFVGKGVRNRRTQVSYGGALARGQRRSGSLVDAVVHCVETPFGQLGVIEDRSHRMLSAVIQLRGDAFLLLDATSRQRIADAWSNALGALAQQPGSIVRLAWLERTVPDHAMRVGAAAISAFATSRDDGLAEARRSYLDLVEHHAAGMLRHECHLVVSVLAAGRSGTQARGEVADGVALITARWSSLGIDTDGALSPSGLRSYLARGFAAGAVVPAGTTDFPLAFSEEWSALHTDGTWHATFWVAEWPRLDVGSDFLLPMLLESGSRRSFAVIMEPRQADTAVRAAERARTEQAADRDLRRRHGFAQSARSVREGAAIIRREQELAEGHGAFRFGGYIAVTSTDRTALERECARVEQAAARAHLVLRRLYGAQREAASFVLPLGRGL